ncbi:hypothetical protein MKW92_000749 [Papaver armeniacum]|nr:hypothetical protein MKW92_000749 [Papaver armeniacum]
MANKNKGYCGSSSSVAAGHTAVTKFEFKELAAATKNFSPDSLLGEGEHGSTFKGCLKSSEQVIAVKQVNKEMIIGVYRSTFLTIHMRSLLHHPNIVDMTGYCIDGNQIYFVHDFMPLGSLNDYLHDKKPLDWNTRMKIAAGAADGIKYLHDESVIHGNIKPSNIILCEGYHPKLSDILGFKERIPEPDESSRARWQLMISRQCYRHAPEFYFNLKLTQSFDIYSFGLVLLELISGRMADIKPSLIEWVKCKLVGGEEFTTVADPLLKGHYPEQGLYQALCLAAECLQTKDVTRPRIGSVVNVLSNLASEIYDPRAIQINRACTLTIGKIEKERLTEQWRHIRCFSY